MIDIRLNHKLRVGTKVYQLKGDENMSLQAIDKLMPLMGWMFHDSALTTMTAGFRVNDKLSLQEEYAHHDMVSPQSVKCIDYGVVDRKSMFDSR
jgi:hypothetical protein